MSDLLWNSKLLVLQAPSQHALSTAKAEDGGRGYTGHGAILGERLSKR